MCHWEVLLDENIDPKTATYVDKEGIDAEHVRDALGLGTADSDILSYARANDRIIVTSDVSDFGGLDHEVHAGIVLVYDDTLPAYQLAAGLIALTDAYGDPAAFGGIDALDPWI